jgi:hypothetical protein
LLRVLLARVLGFTRIDLGGKGEQRDLSSEALTLKMAQCEIPRRLGRLGMTG